MHTSELSELINMYIALGIKFQLEEEKFKSKFLDATNFNRTDMIKQYRIDRERVSSDKILNVLELIKSKVTTSDTLELILLSDDRSIPGNIRSIISKELNDRELIKI